MQNVTEPSTFVVQQGKVLFYNSNKYVNSMVGVSSRAQLDTRAYYQNQLAVKKL